MRRALLGTWQQLNDDTIGTDRYWSIALQNAVSYQDLLPFIRRHVHGRVLDLGAGRLAWRGPLGRFASHYVSGDLAREHPELDLLLDTTRGLPFRDATFDTVFCCSVLEHAPEPWRAFPEMARVLAPGGVAIVSVPLLFYVHGQPHDYYRFTTYGLRYLAESAGLEVLDLRSSGNLADLVLNVPSVVMSVAWARLGLRGLLAPTTRVWVGMAQSMGRLDQSGLFAMNVIAALRKPSATG